MTASSNMLFESTTLLLRSIVHSLEGGDETKWDDHLDYGNQCIYELFQMSRPERRKYQGHVATVFDRASRAIPHVKLMNRAIRQRHRAEAIEYGRAAISEMNGIGQPKASAICRIAETEIAIRLAEGVVPATERRKKTRVRPTAVAKQKSARASTAN